MVQYTQSGGKDSSSLLIATIDSPRFILAVGPLTALLEFAVSPFKQTGDKPSEEVSQETPEEESATPKSSSMAIRVEIVDSTVIVLADDTDPKTQGIQLAIKEILFSQQSVMALKVEKLGMSFGRMDKPNERVRFLDDVNVALSLDNRQRGSQQMTSIELELPDPVIFRASYTDIMLITDIANKAAEAANKALAPPQPSTENPRRPSLTTRTGTDVSSAALVHTTGGKPASARRSSVSRRRGSVARSRVLVSKENVRFTYLAANCLTLQLKARMNGFQFVLVGDLQEMPMVHLSTNEFTLMVNDWSGDVSAGSAIVGLS